MCIVRTVLHFWLIILTTKMAGNDIHDKGSCHNWSVHAYESYYMTHILTSHWEIGLVEVMWPASLRHLVGWGHVTCFIQTSGWLRSCDLLHSDIWSHVTKKCYIPSSHMFCTVVTRIKLWEERHKSLHVFLLSASGGVRIVCRHGVKEEPSAPSQILTVCWTFFLLGVLTLGYRRGLWLTCRHQWG